MNSKKGIMLKNYIKLALRNLTRKKGFTIINLMGLSLGMATALSIALYVSFEWSYDDYHPDAENIFRVILERTADGEMQEVARIPSPVADALYDINGVETVVRLVSIAYQNNSLVRERATDRKVIEADEVYYADSTISDLLYLPLSDGTVKAFQAPHRMLLSSSQARRLFGNAEATGQTVILSNNVGKQEYLVAGVFEDLPANTDFDFEVLLSMASLPLAENEDVLTSWNYWQNLTYVRYQGSPEVVTDELSGLFDSGKQDIRWEAELVPLRELHFLPLAISDQQNPRYIKALTVIGFLVLIIAWVNYINLSTSRALERSKEVGVRKVLGSVRGQLSLQFMVESLVLNILAALIAFTMVQGLRPWLEQIANPLTVSAAQAPYFWTVIIALILTGSLLSGSYPAFVLTSLNPSSILSGRFRHHVSGKFARRGLVVFQFAISIFLLVGTLTVYRQITFMRQTDLGAEIDNRLIINSPPGALRGNTAFFESLDAFRKELLNYPEIYSVTGSSSIPGEPINWGDSNIKRPGTESNLLEMVSLIATDRNFFDVYDVKVIAGRPYRKGDSSFGQGQIVISETASRQFGFATPEAAIGEKLDGGSIFPELTIIGVTEDYHHTSLHDAYAPILFVLSDWANYYTAQLHLPDNPALAADQLSSSVDRVNQVWEKHFPEAPFDYFFADDAFDLQYRQDEEFGFMFGIFTSLAIFLAILGLVGLVSYEVVQRSKEIGIRKVLGARGTDLVNLLTRKYLVLIAIAGCCSIPPAWWLFSEWLDGFAFRIHISPASLILSFGLVLVVSLMVTAGMVLAAARKNPVHSIKYE